MRRITGEEAATSWIEEEEESKPKRKKCTVYLPKDIPSAGERSELRRRRRGDLIPISFFVVLFGDSEGRDRRFISSLFAETQNFCLMSASFWPISTRYALIPAGTLIISAIPSRFQRLRFIKPESISLSADSIWISRSLSKIDRYLVGNIH